MKKKWVIRIALGLVALLIVAVLVVSLMLDGIVRSKVEAAANESVQQPTTLQAADLSVLGGTLGLSRLKIQNPKGYSSENFVDLKQINIAVQTSSLMGDTLVVKDLTMSDMQLNIEQSGLKNNLNEIMGQIQKQRDKVASETPSTSGSQASRQLKIDKLTLKNTKVSLNLGLPGQKAQQVTVMIPEMVMNEPTNADGRLMKVADLMGKVIVAVVMQAKEDANIPPEIKTAINGALAFVNDDMKKMLGDFGKAGEGAATQIGKPVQDVIKGVGDMLKKKETR